MATAPSGAPVEQRRRGRGVRPSRRPRPSSPRGRSGRGRRRAAGARVSGPLSPMRTAASRSAPTTRASSARSTPLSRPPAMSTTGARERAQRRDHRVGLRALGVVDEPDAVEERHRLEPVLDAGERRRPPGGSRPARPRTAGPTAIAASAFETLWAPGMPSSSTGMIPPPGRPSPRRRRRSAGARRPRTRSSRRRRPARPPPGGRAGTGRPGRVPRPGVAADDRVLEVEDERAVRVHELGEAALDPPVRLDAAVPVEVVGGHVGVDGDGRAARQGRQLELGQLDDDAVVGRQLRQPLHERRPDVPAEHRRVERVRGEDRVRERATSSSCPSSR